MMACTLFCVCVFDCAAVKPGPSKMVLAFAVPEAVFNKFRVTLTKGKDRSVLDRVHLVAICVPPDSDAQSHINQLLKRWPN